MNIVFGGSEASSAHFKSGEVEHSASDLFTVPPTNITYNGYRIVEINPTSESITPIEFVLPGSREYIDFSRSYFRVDLILKKKKPMKEIWLMRRNVGWLQTHFTPSSNNLPST